MTSVDATVFVELSRDESARLGVWLQKLNNAPSTILARPDAERDQERREAIQVIGKAARRKSSAFVPAARRMRRMVAIAILSTLEAAHLRKQPLLHNHARIAAKFHKALAPKRPGRPSHQGEALCHSAEWAKQVASLTGAGKKARDRKKDLVRRMAQEAAIDDILRAVRQEGSTLLTYDKSGSE